MFIMRASQDTLMEVEAVELHRFAGPVAKFKGVTHCPSGSFCDRLKFGAHDSVCAALRRHPWSDMQHISSCRKTSGNQQRQTAGADHKGADGPKLLKFAVLESPDKMTGGQ